MYLSSLKKILLQFSNDTCIQENCAFQSSLPTIKTKHLEKTLTFIFKGQPTIQGHWTKGHCFVGNGVWQYWGKWRKPNLSLLFSATLDIDYAVLYWTAELYTLFRFGIPHSKAETLLVVHSMLHSTQQLLQPQVSEGTYNRGTRTKLDEYIHRDTNYQ